MTRLCPACPNEHQSRKAIETQLADGAILNRDELWRLWLVEVIHIGSHDQKNFERRIREVVEWSQREGTHAHALIISTKKGYQMAHHASKDDLVFAIKDRVRRAKAELYTAKQLRTKGREMGLLPEGELLFEDE
jgi:hypothetical protein